MHVVHTTFMKERSCLNVTSRVYSSLIKREGSRRGTVLR